MVTQCQLPRGSGIESVWKRFTMQWRSQTWLLLSVLTIALLLLAFGILAQEVSEKEPLAFDQNVMLALRNFANPSVPVGPAWLQETARDITSLGSTIVLGIITFAVVGYLFLTRRPAVAWLMLGAVLGGVALNNVLKFAFARPRPDFVAHAARVFTSSFPSGHATLSAITYLTMGALPRATPYFAQDTYLFDLSRGISHFAHRYEPSLSQCSLSHRCSWRLVHWRCLGDGLLGTDDMAPAGRSGRAARPFVTAAQV